MLQYEAGISLKREVKVSFCNFVSLTNRVRQLIISIITKKSARGLALSKGKEVYAVIKASNVIIATD